MRVIRRGASFMLTDVLLGGGISWHPAIQGLGKVVVSGVWLGVMGAWSLWILG